MFSYQLSGRLHVVQCDAGQAIDSGRTYADPREFLEVDAEALA